MLLFPTVLPFPVCFKRELLSLCSPFSFSFFFILLPIPTASATHSSTVGTLPFTLTLHKDSNTEGLNQQNNN